MKRRAERMAGVALALAWLAGCATNPVTGKREFTLLSEANEIQIGQELDAEVRQEMGVYEDSELQQYIEQIGMQLARRSHRPSLPWRFAVVDVPAVNAFALPGGPIYVTRGLLAYVGDEAELAGVLGHEIGHITARHAARAYSRAAGTQLGIMLGGIFAPSTRPFGQIAETALGLLFLKHSRDDELEADRLGAEYVAASGWEPSAVPRVLTTLARIEELSDRRGVPNWLATHPQPADRVVRIQETVHRLEGTGAGSPVSNRDVYLRRIDGLVHGDNPREGIARGEAFLHPDLRFAVAFPRGWEIINGQAQVVAKESSDGPLMILQLEEQPRGRDIDEVATGSMRTAGFTLLQGGPTRINGLDAFVGTYDGRVQDLGRVRARVAHIEHDRRVFLLAGLAGPDAYGRVEPEFDRSIRTFRPLAAAEAADIRPNRLDLYVVRRGDTWQSIADHAGRGVVKASTLAIMNGCPPSEQPREGEQVKIVVAG